MPNGEVVAIKKTQPGVILLSAGLIVGGGLLILLAGRKGTAKLKPGEALTGLTTDTFVAGVPLPLDIGRVFAALNPRVSYKGPGRDAYSYFRIEQMQNGSPVTVQASGVAGVHLPSSPTATEYRLVSPDEVQPAGCPTGQHLCAFPWPGLVGSTPLCGAPPQPGPATAILEIYQNQADSGDPRDADGFSSPSCNNRVPVAKRVYTNLITYRFIA